MGNTNTNTNTTIENVYEETLAEETTRRGAYDSEAGQSPRIGILDEIEDAEIARWGHTLTGGRAVGEAGYSSPRNSKRILRFHRVHACGGRAGGGSPRNRVTFGRCAGGVRGAAAPAGGRSGGGSPRRRDSF